MRQASTPLLYLYQFIVRATMNVLFVLSFTSFLKVQGTQGLPYVYTAMNLVYISLQLGSIKRLQADTARYISIGSWAFLTLVAMRAFYAETISPSLATAFLLSLMIFDLFFSQFFFHYLGDVFPTARGKTILPRVAAFGSLSFIASGALLKLILTFASVMAVFRGAVVTFFLANVTFELFRYTAEEMAQASRLSGEEATKTENKEEEESVWPLGRTMAVAAFLFIFCKYWLEYQYSAAINTHFPTEEGLASFIAVFTSMTDLMILIVLGVVTGRLLKQMKLLVALVLSPAIILVCSVITSMSPTFITIVGTQFLFTLFVKAVHMQSTTLALSVLPSKVRVRSMSLSGTASSAGSLLAGLVLVAIQSRLEPSFAFLVLSFFAGAMLLTLLQAGKPYREALERILDEPSSSSDQEHLANLFPEFLAGQLCSPNLQRRATAIETIVRKERSAETSRIALETLSEMVESSQADERETAAYLMGKLAHPVFGPELSKLALSSEKSVVLAAINGLAALGNEKGLPFLKALKIKVRDEEIKTCLAKAISKLERLTEPNVARLLVDLPRVERRLAKNALSEGESELNELVMDLCRQVRRRLCGPLLELLMTEKRMQYRTMLRSALECGRDINGGIALDKLELDGIAMANLLEACQRYNAQECYQLLLANWASCLTRVQDMIGKPLGRAGGIFLESWKKFRNTIVTHLDEDERVGLALDELCGNDRYRQSVALEFIESTASFGLAQGPVLQLLRTMGTIAEVGNVEELEEEVKIAAENMLRGGFDVEEK